MHAASLFNRKLWLVSFGRWYSRPLSQQPPSVTRRVNTGVIDEMNYVPVSLSASQPANRPSRALARPNRTGTWLMLLITPVFTLQRPVKTAAESNVTRRIWVKMSLLLLRPISYFKSRTKRWISFQICKVKSVQSRGVCRVWRQTGAFPQVIRAGGSLIEVEVHSGPVDITAFQLFFLNF